MALGNGTMFNTLQFQLGVI